jgi:hypothetical protein
MPRCAVARSDRHGRSLASGVANWTLPAAVGFCRRPASLASRAGHRGRGLLLIVLYVIDVVSCAIRDPPRSSDGSPVPHAAKVEDLLARFEAVRRAERLDESAAEMLRRQYV